MTLDEFVAFLANPKTRYNHLFHFTDASNIPLIRQHGLLSVKELERQKIVVPRPGGNEWSRRADLQNGVDSFVHLSFKTGHPMEHTVKTDGRVQDLQYLRIKPEIIKVPGAMLTTDVANKSGVVPVPIADGLNLVDLQVLYERTDWKDPQVKARLVAAEKFEILIPERIPPNLIE